jgi:hypothetical protein
MVSINVVGSKKHFFEEISPVNSLIILDHPFSVLEKNFGG